VSYLDLAKGLISHATPPFLAQKSGTKRDDIIELRQGVGLDGGRANTLISLISHDFRGKREFPPEDKPDGLAINQNDCAPGGERAARCEISEISEISRPAWVSAARKARAVCEISPSPRPDWTDDRAWIREIRHATDEAAKLLVLAGWVAAAGGETMARTVMLPALRPRNERRLAELELRRMCEQAGLEILEDEQ
jgi:hypothetical protein